MSVVDVVTRNGKKVNYFAFVCYLRMRSNYTFIQIGWKTPRGTWVQM